MNSKPNFLPLIALLSVILSIFLVANYHRLNLDYIPFNGAFQTFNPVRRILAGEIPGRDFNPYLGLGVTYLTTLFTWLFGGNFAACQFGIYAITLSLHFLVLCVLFFCCGFTRKCSLLGAALAILILSFIFENFRWVNEIVGPGTSNLNLRSALPFLSSLVLLFFWKVLPQSKLIYLGIGFLIGLQPLWSNDYGIPSAFNLIIVTIVYAIAYEKKSRLSKIFLTVISAPIAFYLAGMFLTQGHFFPWLESNFKGVAGDQLWYYLWFNNYNKIFAIKDFFNHPILIVFSCFYLGSIVIIIVRGYLRRYQVKYLILIYISFTVYLAGILSSVGGTLSIRYFLLSAIASFFTVPLSIYLLAPWSINSFFLRINPHNLSPLFCRFLLLIYLAAPAIHLASYATYRPLPSWEKGFIKVEELGGWLSPKWKDSVEIANHLKQKLENTPPQQKMLSTYSTGMDIIVGAINPTKIDYIIHALGEKARKQYLNQWQAFQPQYITILREDAYWWETWARRSNWWFYREFIQNYQLVEATFYNLIWQRLEQPKNLENLQASCQVIPKSKNLVQLMINTPKTDLKQPTTYYVDLTLNYYLKVQSTFIPLIGQRGLVNLIEAKTATKKSIGQAGNYSYGLPPNHSNWHIPLEHKIGTNSILLMKAYPEKRADLTVKSCQAKILVPLDDFALTSQIMPSNLNNKNWKNGILLNSQPKQTSVIIDDDKILSKLYPQMDLEFAGSGSRPILKIQDSQVWLKGEPLDPETDGYPHSIKVKLR